MSVLSRGFVLVFSWHPWKVDFELFLRSLESEFDANLRAESDALVEELADAERVSITLADRLTQMQGNEIEVIVRGGLRAQGRLIEVRTTWILLAEDQADSLIPIRALVALGTLGIAGPPEKARATRIGISTALRALAAARIPIVVDHDAGRHSGLVHAVYADHFDMETGASHGVLDSRDRVCTKKMALVTAGIRRIRVLGRMPSGSSL